jgi:sn1-specific diacylglycerol lipase
VSVYCFAPPCITDEALGHLAANMITSFVYSYDIVSRLSLGSIRDIRNAAMWLCEAQSQSSSKKGQAKGKGKEKQPVDGSGDAAAAASASNGEGYTRLTKRALKFRSGMGSEEDTPWFLSVRKTLEANMQQADLFPPGRIWWAIRDGDLHPKNRSKEALDGGRQSQEKVRLFEVLDARKVFGQIVFAKDMLRYVSRLCVSSL